MGLTVQKSEENYNQLNQTKRVQKQGTDQVDKKKQAESVYAGDLNLMDMPSVEEKKKEAKEKALKVIQDAWESDRAIDEAVNERKSHYEEMKNQIGEAQSKLNEMNGAKEELKEIYQVDNDSEEQKDLELLEKRQEYFLGDKSLTFTDEEKAHLSELDKNGITEYQKQALEYNETAYQYKGEIEKAKTAMADDAGDMRAIAIERLKSHPMVDAQKSADSIREAASKEIVGMLMEEAKNHVDEKQEEEEEKAEETEKENEEKEKQIEEIKEKIAIQEALIEGTKEAVEEAKKEVERNEHPEIDMEDMVDIAKTYSQSGDVQQSLNDIKDSMKLLEADLKGIKVDEQV